MKNFLRGSATALITPFNEKGVNFSALEKLIQYQIENGTDALVVLGTTGEASTMTEEERNSVISFAVQCAKGKCKIIIGTGSNCTQKAVLFSKKAEELGADGVIAVTPYYNKCTQKGLIDYYQAIALSVQIPVIAYNVPSRTGVNILPETMAQIADMDNIAGIKEASGNMAQAMETMRLIRGKCDLYSGEDALNFPILASGGMAVISVVSNLLPKEIKTLTQLIAAGDYRNALVLNDRLLPVAKACFSEVNPIPVKAGLNLMGFDVGVPRAPLSECEPQNIQKLKEALKDFGVNL